MNSIKSNELRWQTEEDARTMARYQEIMSDRSRMARATKEAKRQASDLEKRASLMNRAASTKRK